MRPTILIPPKSFIEKMSEEITKHTSSYGTFTSLFYNVTVLSRKFFVTTKFENSKNFFDHLAFFQIKQVFGDFRHLFTEDLVDPFFLNHFNTCFSSNVYNCNPIYFFIFLFFYIFIFLFFYFFIFLFFYIYLYFNRFWWIYNVPSFRR